MGERHNTARPQQCGSDAGLAVHQQTVQDAVVRNSRGLPLGFHNLTPVIIEWPYCSTNGRTVDGKRPSNCSAGPHGSLLGRRRLPGSAGEGGRAGRCGLRAGARLLHLYGPRPLGAAPPAHLLPVRPSVRPLTDRTISAWNSLTVPGRSAISGRRSWNHVSPGTRTRPASEAGMRRSRGWPPPLVTSSSREWWPGSRIPRWRNRFVMSSTAVGG